MTQENAADHSGGHDNEQEIAIVAAHPMVSMRRLAQVLGTPVRYDIAVVAVVIGHDPAFPVPALVRAPAMHHRTVLAVAVVVVVMGLGCHCHIGHQQGRANGHGQFRFHDVLLRECHVCGDAANGDSGICLRTCCPAADRFEGTATARRLLHCIDLMHVGKMAARHRLAAVVFDPIAAVGLSGSSIRSRPFTQKIRG